MGLRDSDFFDSDSYESSDTKIIICKECSAHLCLSHHVLSDEFTGSSGPAYLVDTIINYAADPHVQETKMVTGDYLVQSVSCKQCKTRLGWTYKKSFKYTEAYKEGKFVIENKFIKFIPNNSATTDLVDQARKSHARRRRLSATLSSSSSFSEDDLFKFLNLPQESPKGFRSLYTTNRLRFQGLKDFDEKDENDDVFVDV